VNQLSEEVVGSMACKTLWAMRTKSENQKIKDFDITSWAEEAVMSSA